MQTPSPNTITAETKASVYGLEGNEIQFVTHLSRDLCLCRLNLLLCPLLICTWIAICLIFLRNLAVKLSPKQSLSGVYCYLTNQPKIWWPETTSACLSHCFCGRARLALVSPRAAAKRWRSSASNVFRVVLPGLGSLWQLTGGLFLGQLTIWRLMREGEGPRQNPSTSFYTVP